jgi:hypothetical protein
MASGANLSGWKPHGFPGSYGTTEVVPFPMSSGNGVFQLPTGS